MFYGRTCCAEDIKTSKDSKTAKQGPNPRQEELCLNYQQRKKLAHTVKDLLLSKFI